MRIKIFFLYLVFFAKVGFTQKTSIEYYNLGLLCPYDNSDSINKKAIYYFTNAIILDSNCVKCYLERANRNSDSDPENALIDYKQALRLDPNCNKCYQEIADFYRIILKDYKAARVNYYNALKTLNPISEQDFVDQFYYIQSIGLTYFSEQQNDNGRRKNNQVCIAIWDSLINLYPLTQYYEQRANLKSSHFIADYKGALQEGMPNS
jgi:tetratricopeptide (TPR) repeat protein